MTENGKGILADESATDEEVAEAMEKAIYEALRHHKRSGVPVAVWDWENDRVVIVPPEEIIVPDETSDAAGEAIGSKATPGEMPDPPASS
jgi:hypothetical protein